MIIRNEVTSAMYEYDSSMTDFFRRFNASYSQTDTFVYCDSSFGIMSYYYSESRHIRTYNEPWFAAPDNVEYIDKDEISTEIKSSDKAWFVKNKLTNTPKYLENNFDMELVDSFKCDFNTFEAYFKKLYFPD